MLEKGGKRRKKQKIVNHVKTMGAESGKRKTFRVGDCAKMDNALYMRFIQAYPKHIPVSGKLLKAIEFCKIITNKDDFRASDAWLDKLKKRFGFRLLTIFPEKEF